MLAEDERLLAPVVRFEHVPAADGDPAVGELRRVVAFGFRKQAADILHEPGAPGCGPAASGQHDPAGPEAPRAPRFITRAVGLDRQQLTALPCDGNLKDRSRSYPALPLAVRPAAGDPCRSRIPNIPRTHGQGVFVRSFRQGLFGRPASTSSGGPRRPADSRGRGLTRTVQQHGLGPASDGTGQDPAASAKAGRQSTLCLRGEPTRPGREAKSFRDKLLPVQRSGSAPAWGSVGLVG